jgi:hypothetical protein
MRTGSVNPKLDAYFNWPGFFILSAFVTRIVGDHDVLSLAAWAPVFFNLIYLGPLYMIFTSATTDKRLVWLGLWFFYLTNWIGQDYFSPQALNYFLYLVIIAILLKWFQAPPGGIPRLHWRYFGNFSFLAQMLYKWLTMRDSPRTVGQPRQRIALLVSLVLVFILVVFSHPLTPFLVLGSVTTLVVFHCCTLRWLPLLIAAMTCAWIIFMTQAFLAGHTFLVTGSLGQVDKTITANVLNRAAQGSSEHNFISAMRVIMTVAIWGLAFAGAVRRLRRGYRDVAYALLAVTPFTLILAQSYGGEMLLRIYLFTLPLMVFFAAALFSITLADGRSPWMTLAVTATSVILLSGFLFTRYGNERMDYMTYAEVNGVHQLYNIAQPNSLLIQGWNGTPWQFQDYEKYSYYSLTDILPDAVRTGDVNSIVQFIDREKHPHTYLIFTRSQKATTELFSGLPPGTLDRLENALLRSKEFKLVYNNPDVQIFTLDRQ